MKNWILLTTFILGVTSCTFEETAEETGSPLYSGHKEVENSIELKGPPADNYVEGDTIVFTVTHPYALTVTGTPRLILDVGGAAAYANYSAGNGSKTLTFSYSVAAGENDSDGIAMGSTSIDLNGGGITFEGTNGTEAASLDFSSPDLSGVLVDTTAPANPSLTEPVAGTYYLDFELNFIATYGEAVYVTGTPRIPLDIGGSTVYAEYVSGSGTTNLLFKYIVTSADYDMNGLTSSAIDLNGGSIKDGSGNDAGLVHTPTNHATVNVDGDSPLVGSFIPPADGVYEPGDSLDFSLQFTEIVNVTGSPRVGIDIGGAIRYASYISGTGSDTLLFRYSIVSGNVDEDGIDVANEIDLNGGDIQDGGGRSVYTAACIDPNATTCHPFDAPQTTGATIDAILPAVESVTLPTPPADNYFNSGEEIYITLNFNDVVDVTGFPQLGMQLDSSGSTIYIDYNSGSGTSSLVFRYVVVDEVDEDHTGLTLVSPLLLNGGTIQNDSLTNADLDITNAITGLDTSAMLVDATTPVVDSITAPGNGVYIIGDQIDFTVNFSEIVNVTGTPRIPLDIGGSTRYATYAGGTGTQNLTFRWTVQNSFEDTDGIGIVGTTIQTNGGLIEDRGGNETDYDITGHIPNLASVLVDGIRPQITSVTIPAATYTNGQTVTATVTFDDTVNVAAASPIIAGTFDNAGAGTDFTYQTGTGSNSLTFEYVVNSGDDDDTGIDLSGTINLAGATIQDVNGNDAVLNFTDTAFPSVFLDAAPPTVTITSPTNGDYINQAADSTTYAITGSCDDAGATYSILTNGTAATGQSASCDGVNLTGTFDSTAEAEGAITIAIFADDGNGNTSTSTGVSVTKDTLAPSITLVTPPGAANYTTGSTLDFTVDFDDTVTITGTRLALALTTGTVHATYTSGSGTTSATYSYTITDSDNDEDGIGVSSPLDLNGGSIQDAAGNDATLTFAPPGAGSVLVNNGTPIFDWQGENGAGDHDYGNPGTNLDHTFTIENTGDAPALTSINISITGDPKFTVQTDNCSGIILPISGTCTVTIRYSDPSAGSVVRTATATVDDAGHSPNPGYDMILNGD